MKTLTIELPDELFAKLAALPVAERKAQAKHELVNGEYAQVVQDNFLAAVYEEIFADWVASQQPSTQEEAGDVVAVVNESYTGLGAGKPTFSLEEMLARYGVSDEELQSAPDGIINGHVK